MSGTSAAASSSSRTGSSNEALGLPNCVLPRAAIDSRSLVYAADVMIGAGGTMTREAAVMGIPTWTLFAGKTPAVDEWLERRGMLSRLTGAEQLADLTPRRSSPSTLDELHQRATALVDVLVRETLAAAGDGISDPVVVSHTRAAA